MNYIFRELKFFFKCKNTHTRICFKSKEKIFLELKLVYVVKSQAIKKFFKHMLFSLAPDGSRDKQEGSKRLTNLNDIAPAFEELLEKYEFKVPSNVAWDLRLFRLSKLRTL